MRVIKYWRDEKTNDWVFGYSPTNVVLYGARELTERDALKEAARRIAFFVRDIRFEPLVKEKPKTVVRYWSDGLGWLYSLNDIDKADKTTSVCYSEPLDISDCRDVERLLRSRGISGPFQFVKIPFVSESPKTVVRYWYNTKKRVWYFSTADLLRADIETKGNVATSAPDATKAKINAASHFPPGAEFVEIPFVESVKATTHPEHPMCRCVDVPLTESSRPKMYYTKGVTSTVDKLYMGFFYRQPVRKGCNDRAMTLYGDEFTTILEKAKSFYPGYDFIEVA